MGELGVNLVKQKREFIIITFLGETLDIDHVYKKLGVSIGVYKMKVNNTFRIT
jgi:transposase